MTSDLKKCFIEFLGTFFITYAYLCCYLLPIKGVLAPIAIGFALIAAMYAGGNISGGNYNPLITLSILFSGKMGSKKALLYCIFQIFGAAYAALMASFLSPAFTTPAEQQFNNVTVFWGEIVFTTILILVFLFTCVSKKTKNNEYFGLALGTTLISGYTIAGTICFATFNPFILIAFLLLGYISVKIFIISLIAQILAMFIAFLLFTLLNIDNVEDVEVVRIDEFIRK